MLVGGVPTLRELHRAIEVVQDPSQMSHPCSHHSTYLLDATVAYDHRVGELIPAYYKAKYLDDHERTTAQRGGSDGSREFTRAILREAALAIGNAGALVGEAINLQTLVNEYAGDLSGAIPTVLLTMMADRANDRINQLALTSGETLGDAARLYTHTEAHRAY